MPVLKRLRKRRGLPLSFRVASIYAMLVASTLLVVAGLAIQFTRGQVTNSMEASLESFAERFQATVPTAVDTNVAAGQSHDDALNNAAVAWLQQTALPIDEAAFVQLAQSTKPLALTSDFVLPHNALVVFNGTSPGWFTFHSGDSTYRLLRVPLTLNQTAAAGTAPGPVGALVLAAQQSALVNHSISSLMKDIAFASLIGLAFATTLGLFAVRRTLRPLEQMVQDVESIEETDDLSIRVGGLGPADEVGRLGEAFDGMLGRLQESFLGQRRFLSDASHELRTPMTVVRGQLELLAMEIDSHAGRRSMSIALEELDRMGRIVEDLLLLARLDEGMTLARDTVEVSLIVGEALLRGMVIGTQDVKVKVPADLMVMADGDRLLQVLTNLVTNAVRHGRGALIEVSAWRDAGTVCIRVADQGPGIASEELPHIFDRLYRGQRARSDSPTGAGLGLAIAASLVRAMGGNIGVSSALGVGTAFTVILPAADPGPGSSYVHAPAVSAPMTGAR